MISFSETPTAKSALTLEQVLVDHLFQPLALMKYACHLQKLGLDNNTQSFSVDVRFGKIIPGVCAA